MPKARRRFEAGAWHGWSAYDSSPDRRLPMQMTLEIDGANIAGSGRDDDGAFTVAGSLGASDEVRLEKRYEGGGEVRTLELAGTWDAASAKLTGPWRIGGQRHGVFSIEPGVPKPPRVARGKAPAPVAMPADPDRLAALVARALVSGDAPYAVGKRYKAAFAALRAFAERRAFRAATSLAEPLAALERAREELASTVRGPLPAPILAQAVTQARGLQARAEAFGKALESLPPLRFELLPAERDELSQLLATWLAELRVEAQRARNAVFVTQTLGDLLAEMETEWGGGTSAPPAST